MSDDESIDLGNRYQYFSGQVDGNQENLSSLPWNFGTIEDWLLSMFLFNFVSKVSVSLISHLREGLTHPFC